jgi:hypothetical protein
MGRRFTAEMYASRLPRDGTTDHGLDIARAVLPVAVREVDIPETPFICRDILALSLIEC